MRITLPDGDTVSTDEADVEPRLSARLGRTVRLTRSAFEGAPAEGYWPDHDWLAQRDETFEFPLPAGTFFDGALVHLITTATLDRLRSIAPAGRFEPRRFRPNFVIQPADGATGFVENGWIGRTLQLGDVLPSLVHVPGEHGAGRGKPGADDGDIALNVWHCFQSGQDFPLPGEKLAKRFLSRADRAG